MSRLLRALRVLGVAEEDASDPYDDDFLDGLQNSPSQLAQIEIESTDSASASGLSSNTDSSSSGDAATYGDLQLARFVWITSRLPVELKVKIFRTCFSRFYEIDLLPYLTEPSLLTVLRPFYDELLVGDGKLYFGGFNEYDVVTFDGPEYELFWKLVDNGSVKIRLLKIFDLDNVTDDRITPLLEKAEQVWCASTTALTKIYALQPDVISRVTDLSVEDLDQLLRRTDIKEIFHRLAVSLKNFTLSLTPDDSEKVQVIFDTLKQADHPLTVHLPVSFPLDGGRDVRFFDSLLDPYGNVELAHILFTLVCPDFDIDDLKEFVHKVGVERFTDFCLVSFPNFRINGDLHFIDELTNLITVVLSGTFTLTTKSFCNLCKLTKLKELMLEGCKLSDDWFNSCLPPNLRDLTVSNNSFPGSGTFVIPPSLKILTVISKDGFTLKLDNLDFSQSNLSVLKFRVEDEIACSSLSVTFNSLPPTIREINCYKLTSFVVEKDIKLNNNKNLVVNITLNEGLPKGFDVDALKANVNVNFRTDISGQYVSLGMIERIDSIGAFA